jgi:hypothetical protein
MNLDVLIPSLFLPDPVLKMFPAPHAPALAAILARADRQASGHASAGDWLCERWGIAPPCPFAAILAAFDGIDTQQPAGWLLAEPVNMATQSKTLKLFPARFLGLTADECGQFVEALNGHFSARGLTFFAAVADRWYVRCAHDEIPVTAPVDQARLGSMLECQPQSHGKINWRAIQNEIQMLFHTHPVNAAREADGRPRVDGVWFWGGGHPGTLPGAIHAPDYDAVLANEPIAVQLARQSGIAASGLAIPSAHAGIRSALAVIDTCHHFARDLEMQKWVAEVERLDREWFKPVAQKLRAGDIGRLTLFSPDGVQTHAFTITRSQLALRFWRKPVSLSTHA